MSLIDDRGRLFGKVNLIDAVVGLLVLGLIPLAYGAFLLFRVPMPKITAIAPVTVVEHQAATLHVTGQDLRPFLRARFGTTESPGFLVQSPTLADIKLPDLPAGTYDLVLFDEGQELLRKPAAVTVVAPPAVVTVARKVPQADVQVVGRFLGLAAEDVRVVAIGAAFSSKTAAERGDEPLVGEVLAVRPPEAAMQRVKVAPNTFLAMPVPGQTQVAAIVRLRCVLPPTGEDCRIGDTPVAENQTLLLPVPPLPAPGATAASVVTAHRPEQLKFFVEEVRAAGTRPVFPVVRHAVADLVVRFVARPQTVALLKVGDLDVSGASPVAGDAVADPEAGPASLAAIGAGRRTLTALTGVDVTAGRPYQVPQEVTEFEATLRVPVRLVGPSWRYNGKPVKVGAPFAFETTSYAMDGWVLDVKTAADKGSRP
jgi:hypothetical protein